jgi:hypothetical protein
MPDNSLDAALIYVLLAVGALLNATAAWVAARARITSEVERAISSETGGPSKTPQRSRVSRGSRRGAPARKKS